MPPVGDGYEFPALEWCSLEQALKWIAFRDWPVAHIYQPHVEQHHMDVGDERFEASYEKLMSFAGLGRISLRGEHLLNKKLDSVRFEKHRPVFDLYECSGIIELLPNEHLHTRACTNGVDIVWSNTCITPDDCYRAYRHVHVNTKHLLRTYPPEDGILPRYDGGPVLINPQKHRREHWNPDAWVTITEAVQMLKRDGEGEAKARNRLEYRLGQCSINIGYLVRISCEDEDGWSLDTIHIHKDDFPWHLARIDWEHSIIDLMGATYRLFNPTNTTMEIRLSAEDIIASEDGLKPNDEADSKAFNGPSLTLPQVLRWLLYQDIAKVNRTNSNVTLTEARIAHLTTGLNAEAQFAEALNTVHASIADKRLTLTAIKVESMEPTKIEPYEMAHLRFIDTDSLGAMSVCLALATNPNSASAVRYREPRFLPNEVASLKINIGDRQYQPSDDIIRAPGRKPGKLSPKKEMCNYAFIVLEGNLIPSGHGRITAVARAIKKEFQEYDTDTIRKYINAYVKEWEDKNPGR